MSVCCRGISTIIRRVDIETIDQVGGCIVIATLS